MNILFQSVPCLFCWISRNPSLVKTGGPYVSPNVDLCFFEIRRIPDIRESAWIGVLRFGIFSKFFSNQTQNGKQIFQTFGDVAPLQRSDEMSPPSQRQASIDYPIGYDWIEVGCFANRAFTL